MALAVIAEFDDKFFDALGDDDIKGMIDDPNYDDLYKITRTSSRNCSMNNQIVDDTLPQDGNNAQLLMKINFIQQGPGFLIMRLIYKFFRVIQISVWFYFLPFMALLGSYIVPFYY